MNGITLRLPAPHWPHISPWWYWVAAGAGVWMVYEAERGRGMQPDDVPGLMRSMTGDEPSEGYFKRVLPVGPAWAVGTGPVPCAAEAHVFVKE